MKNPIRVLYVDDNPYDQQLVQHALEVEDGGFQVIQAFTQEEFAYKLKHEDFEIVLSDFNILGFEGLQVIQLVKANLPDTDVIILTGTGSEEIAVQATKSGAADYVIKTPKHIQRLPLTIRSVLEQKELARQKAQVEQALEENRRRLEALFNFSMDALVLADDAGRFIDANPAACTLFGYSLAELRERDVFDVTPVEQRETREIILRELLHSGKQSGEFEIVRKDGVMRSVEYSSVANILPGVHLSALRDITTRLEAERRLIQARDYYLTLFENFPALIWRAGLDGLCDYFNQTWLAFTGRSMEQERGEGWVEGVHPDDKPYVIERYMEAFSRRQSFEMEYRLMRYDRQYRWIIDIGRPYQDLDGEFAGYIGACFDITEQKRQQQKLKEAEQEIKLAYAQEREQRELAEVLRDISNLLNLRIDRNEALDKLLALIVRVIPFDTGVILQIKDGNAYVSHQYGYEFKFNPDVLPKLFELSFDLAATRNLRELVENKEPAVIVDINQYDGWLNPLDEDYIRSWAGAPVIIHDQVIAIISLSHFSPDFFQPRHAELLGSIANQTALALENTRLLNDILTSRQRLQQLSNQLVEVQEMERRQIARELHDEVGQVLTGLKLIMKMGHSQPNNELRDSLEEANRLVGDLLSRVREMSLNLRPAMLDDLGLLPALLWQFDRIKHQAGIEIEFQHKGILDQRFDTRLETAAYRIIQEGLTNFVRHADSKRISIAIIVTDGAMNLRIQDEGAGFDFEKITREKITTGLTNMQERVTLLGGKMTIRSHPGQGTQIDAWIPLTGWLERRSYER